MTTAYSAFEITPSDSADLPGVTTGGIYVGGAGSGNLTVELKNGKTVKFTGLAVSTVLPIMAKKVFATGTDVTNLVGLIAQQ